MSEELKPCPFCGGRATLTDGRLQFWVQCDDCGAWLGGKDYRHLDHLYHGDVSDEEADRLNRAATDAVDWDAVAAEAIAAWNRRAPLADAAQSATAADTDAA